MTVKWYHYLLVLLAGPFLANFLPHFISGIVGNSFPSPFSDPPGVGVSGPVSNMLWATINLAVGLLLLYFGRIQRQGFRGAALLLISAMAMAFYLAAYFGRVLHS